MAVEMRRHRYENVLTVLAVAVSITIFCLAVFFAAEGSTLLANLGMSEKDTSELINDLNELSVFVLMPLLPLVLWAVRLTMEGEIRANALQVDEELFPELFATVQTFSGEMGFSRAPELFIAGSEIPKVLFESFAPRSRCIVITADMAAFTGRDVRVRNFHVAREMAQLALGYSGVWRASVAVIPRLLVLPGAALMRAQTYSADAMAARLIPHAAADYLLFRAFGRELYPSINRDACEVRWKARSKLSLEQLTSEFPLLLERYLAIRRLLVTDRKRAVDGRLV